MKDNPTPPAKNKDGEFKALIDALKDKNERPDVTKEAGILSAKLQNELLKTSNELTIAQQKSLEGMITALNGSKLKDLETAKEDRDIAEKTLKLLKGIEENTEPTKLEGAAKLSAGLLSIPMAVLALGAGLVIGLAEAFKDLIKLVSKGTFKAINGITKRFGLDFVKIGNALTDGLSKAFKSLRTGAVDKFKDIGKSLTRALTNIRKAFDAGFDGLKTFRNTLGRFTKVGFFGTIGSLLAKLSNIIPKNFKIPTLSFKPLTDGIKNLKNYVLEPFKGIGKNIELIKSLTSTGKFGTTLKPILSTVKSVMKVVKSITAIAFKVGRVFGRLFYPIKILMGVWDTVTGAIDGFKKYSDKGFLEGIVGGLFGGLSGLLVGLIGIPFDLLKDGISWIAGKLGFENFSEMLDSFSFSDMIANLFTAITDTIVGFIGNIKDSIADIGIGATIANMAIDLLKILKKIAMFPLAVAAGAVLGLAAAWPGGDSPGEAFMKGFNAVMTAGDTTLDSMKIMGDGKTETGEEINSISGNNELDRTAGQMNSQPTVNSVSSVADNSVTNGGTYVMTSQKPNRTLNIMSGQMALSR